MTWWIFLLAVSWENLKISLLTPFFCNRAVSQNIASTPLFEKKSDIIFFREISRDCCCLRGEVSFRKRILFFFRASLGSQKNKYQLKSFLARVTGSTSNLETVRYLSLKMDTISNICLLIWSNSVFLFIFNGILF